MSRLRQLMPSDAEGMDTRLGGIPLLCQRLLIVINIIASVKSVELIYVGASLYVLEPVLSHVLSGEEVRLKSSDPQKDYFKSDKLVHLLAIFLLIVAPIFLMTALSGIFGSYRKSTRWLIVYLILLIISLLTSLVLCLVKTPSQLLHAEVKWLPLAELLLVTVIMGITIVCFGAFLTIYFVITLRNKSQVHPLPRVN